MASVLSAALNAPLITLVTFTALTLYLSPSNALAVFTITSIFGCFLPLGMVYALLKLEFIKDFYAFERDTRTIPFLWSTFFYLSGTIGLIIINAPSIITSLMTCYVINGLVLLLITLKWKISIHASGITSPITALVFLLGSTMLPLFFLILPVAWARVYLKAHSIIQVVAGAIISTSLTWLQMNFYIHTIFIR